MVNRESEGSAQGFRCALRPDAGAAGRVLDDEAPELDVDVLAPDELLGLAAVEPLAAPAAAAAGSLW